MRGDVSASDEDTISSETGRLLEEGETFARRFVIRDLVGIGGFARVYRAVDTHADRDVAIKLHMPQNPEELEDLPTAAKRFYREARLLAQLESPNTIELHDYGRTADGLLYMVCEFIEGTELKTLLQTDAPFRETRARNIAVQILRSLRDAHSMSILHRDVKPSNIMICDGGDGSELVKVLDFGIAKSVAAEKERTQNLTAEGVVVGTPKYMAPEQTRGQPLRGASDLFSVGLLVYEMLVGTSPYESSTLRSVRERLRAAPIRLPVGLDVDDDFRRVTNWMLERDLEDRVDSAQVALEELGDEEGEVRDEPAQSAPGLQSGVSYPLGLGGQPGSGRPSVTAGDDTTSEEVYTDSLRAADPATAKTSVARIRVDQGEFEVSPTVVDPDVRPPAFTDEEAANDETALLPVDPDDGGSTDREGSGAGVDTDPLEAETVEEEGRGLSAGLLVSGGVAVAAVVVVVGVMALQPRQTRERGASDPVQPSATERGASPESPKDAAVAAAVERAAGRVAASVRSGARRAEQRRRARDERGSAGPSAGARETKSTGDPTRDDNQPEPSPPPTADRAPEPSESPPSTAAKATEQDGRPTHESSGRERGPSRSPSKGASEETSTEDSEESSSGSSQGSPAIKPVDELME